MPLRLNELRLENTVIQPFALHSMHICCMSLTSQKTTTRVLNLQVQVLRSFRFTSLELPIRHLPVHATLHTTLW